MSDLRDRIDRYLRERRSVANKTHEVNDHGSKQAKNADRQENDPMSMESRSFNVERLEASGGVYLWG